MFPDRKLVQQAGHKVDILPGLDMAGGHMAWQIAVVAVDMGPAELGPSYLESECLFSPEKQIDSSSSTLLEA